jgi:hypothetical protein
MDLRKVELEGVDWIHLDYNRDWWCDIVNEASIKGGEFD